MSLPESEVDRDIRVTGHEVHRVTAWKALPEDGEDPEVFQPRCALIVLDEERPVLIVDLHIRSNWDIVSVTSNGMVVDDPTDILHKRDDEELKDLVLNSSGFRVVYDSAAQAARVLLGLFAAEAVVPRRAPDIDIDIIRDGADDESEAD